MKMIACKTCKFGRYNPPTNRDYAYYVCHFRFDENDLQKLKDKAPEKAKFNITYPGNVGSYRINEAPKQCRAWKQKIQ